MTIAFTKAQSAQGDFIVLLDADGELDLAHAHVAELCHRRRGIGAEGVVRIVRTGAWSSGPDIKSAPITAGDVDAEWFVEMRRSDGAPLYSPSALCVAAEYLVDRGLVTVAGGALTLATEAGLVDLRKGASGFHLDAGRWQLADVEPLVSVSGLTVARPGLLVTVAGVPSIVIALADEHEFAACDLSAAPDVEGAPGQPEFICVVLPEDPLVADGTGRIHVRAHQRGGGESLSGGYGAAAACLATRHWAQARQVSQWRATLPGGHVWARMFATEEGEHVATSQQATLVYDGTIALPDSSR